MISTGESIEAFRKRLEQEVTALQREWDSAGLVWRDEVCDRFDRDFWTPIREETDRYLRAAQEVADAMRSVDLRDR